MVSVELQRAPSLADPQYENPLPRARLIDVDDVQSRFEVLGSESESLARIVMTIAKAPAGNYVEYEGDEITRVQMYRSFVREMDAYGEQFLEEDRLDKLSEVHSLVEDMTALKDVI
jgi:hypothetical protein